MKQRRPRKRSALEAEEDEDQQLEATGSEGRESSVEAVTAEDVKLLQRERQRRKVHST